MNVVYWTCLCSASLVICCEESNVELPSCVVPPRPLVLLNRTSSNITYIL